MTPKVPEEYMQIRRNQIIEAACKCFVEKGFHNTTMKDICKAANLSPGAVYNYFSSKEDIVTAFSEISMKRNVDIITTATTNSNNPLGKVMDAFFSMAEEYSKQPEFVKSAALDLDLFAESSRNDHIAKELYKNVEAILAPIIKLVKSRQHDGIYNSQLDPRAIASVLFVLFQGMELLIMVDPKIDINSYISVCKAIIHGRFSKEEGKVK